MNENKQIHDIMTAMIAWYMAGLAIGLTTAKSTAPLWVVAIASIIAGGIIGEAAHYVARRIARRHRS